MAFTSRIIMDFGTIIIQYRLLSPAVFETMQMDHHPRRMQCFDLLKKVKHTPIIDRVRYVQAHDM
jgi:hypothetical protein